MSSVHLDPRGKSPYWYCAFCLPNGKRAYRSTRQTDKKLAEFVCQKWAEVSETARHQNLTEAQLRRVLDSIMKVLTTKR